MSDRWVLRPLMALTDPTAYPFATHVAAIVNSETAAGPYVFSPDGSYRLRAGWEEGKDGYHKCVDHKASSEEAEQIALRSVRSGRSNSVFV